jgi:copper chaperone CopZ
MRYQINLPKNSLRGVIPGMVGASVYGTARRGVDSSMMIAGKTGSCIGQGSWVGLFASVAPVENPKFAVIVITRGEAERGRHAAAIAGKIYQTLKPRIFENDNRNLAKLPLELKPQPQINAKISAQIDNVEGVESEDNDVPTITERQIGKKENNPKTAANIVENTTDLFPSVVIKVKKPENEITRPRIVQK